MASGGRRYRRGPPSVAAKRSLTGETTKESTARAAATIAVPPKIADRLQPSVLQKTDAEGRDTVSELVKGNDASRHGGRDRGQFLLAKADGERRQH